MADLWHELARFWHSIPSPVIAIITSGLGLFVGQRWGLIRAKQQWKRHEALDRVNVSLNILSDDTLRIRTIFERPLGDIVPNQHARAMLISAARNCTGAQPLVLLSDKNAQEDVLKCILNATAEQFSGADVLRDSGVPVTTVKYQLFLTCEPATDTRHRKMRAFMLRTDLLENFPYHSKTPQLEKAEHIDRVNTLRTAVGLYKTNPELFMPLEICIGTTSGDSGNVRESTQSATARRA